LDDFGAGGSSLTYLSRLPVDRLKLDQSLIHRMTQDPATAAVTRLIVSLGAELGIDVIAKGVENRTTTANAFRPRLSAVQGYLLGRPMPAQQAQLALRKTWGDRPVPMQIPPKSKDHSSAELIDSVAHWIRLTASQAPSPTARANPAAAPHP